MNTSEIKKIIWTINLIIGLILTMLTYFIYQQLSTPTQAVKPFEYTEPTVNNSPNFFAKGLTRAEIEKEFGWKVPVEKKETIIENQNIIPENIIPATQNINNFFTLNVILGKLVFIYIIKDDQLKSLVKGDEIIDKKGEVLGVLKEIHEESVLILFKGKIEELKMVSDSIIDIYNKPSAGDLMKTAFGAPASHQMPKSKELNSNPPKTIEAVKTTITKQKEDLIFEANQSLEADGTIYCKVSSELIEKLGTKEWSQKMSSANSYTVEYNKNGILIKNINDPEVKKILTAFGIIPSDIIVSVNGQELGNKTEDDLISLYQQISSSTKSVTIELIRNNMRQKYRISK